MTDPDYSVDAPANRSCLDKARDGEPMFIILGRDPDGATIVREWAARRAHAEMARGGDPAHALSAMPLADAMAAYAADPANAPASAPPAQAYPPSPQEAATFFRGISDELVLTKLVARLFRVLILGNVVVEDSPRAMDWLRDYIDGTLAEHGPLGKPMIWPDRLQFVADLLRGWGFQPTPTVPPYVSVNPAHAQVRH